MADHTLVLFENFRVGEYGVLNPVEYGRILRSGHEAAATVAHTGMWTGQSMTILPDGSLCPMPEPAAVATSLPALAGAVVDMGMGNNGSQLVPWIKAGNKIYQSGTSGGSPTFTFTALTGTSANALSYLDHIQASNILTFAVTTGNVLEQIDHSAGTIAAAAGSPPACTTVRQFNDRLMLGGAGVNANRLYFSAAGNFVSWPAANFIDVGDVAPIVALIVMRGFLLIVKAGGTDATWWVLRGTPGVNATLQRASRFVTPTDPTTTTVANGITLLGDNRAAFTTPTNTNGLVSAASPAYFDGTTGRLETLQEGFLAANQTTEAYWLAAGNDVLFKQFNQMLLRQSNAYRRLVVPAALQVDPANFTATARSMVVDPSGSTFYMLNAASDTFYKWHPYVTRPAFVADTDGAPPTTSAPLFFLPEWRSPLGSEVAVTGVVIEFRKWNTGDTGHVNQFDVRLSSTSPFGGGDSTIVATQSFTEAASVSSSTGTTARVNLSFPQQFGNGFILRFQNVRGVAIQTVAVFCELRPIQGLS